MSDEEIIELYWKRSELALEETARKYGSLCYSVAYRILRDCFESEECVNDGYLRAWNAIPPQRPQKLPAFLAKIVRNLALNLLEKKGASKRGGEEITLALEELGDCIPMGTTPEEWYDRQELIQLLNSFLASLKYQDRIFFLLRYWELRSVKEVAKLCGVGQSRVKMSLMRSRCKLRDLLEREGIVV